NSWVLGLLRRWGTAPKKGGYLRFTLVFRPDFGFFDDFFGGEKFLKKNLTARENGGILIA
ncbi:MAG: hypothetical protein LBH43_20740, partial [Treponema sp.]|nr:hypothetical protein [Treponema sp.]